MEESLIKKAAGLAPAVISGIMVMLAFPAYDLYVLAWFAFVPFLLSLWGKNTITSFVSGFAFGITYFFGTLSWIYHSIHHYGGVSLPMSLVIVLLLCAYLSLYPAVFASVYSLLIGKTRLPAVLVVPVAWVVLEFVRSYALTGFPWASIGYSQYKFLPAIQIADITGIYGVSFLILAFNGALVDLLLLKKRLREMPLFPLAFPATGFVFLVVLIIASLGYGSWRLKEQRGGNVITASVVQGNIEQDKKWEPQFQKEVLDVYFALAGEAAKASPNLIVWPETSVPFLFNHDQYNTEALIQFQKGLSTYQLFGSVMVKEQAAGKTLLTNSAILLDRGGKAIYKYDKIHLVPFGEYVPLRSVLFFIDKIAAGIGDYIPGNPYLMAGTEFGSFGTMICYEIIFPGLVRKFFTKGGDFMVTITNDAWFGKTAGPYQHFSMAVFRAIENRKPVVRSANTGVSGFIDSNGRILAASSLFERQVLSQDIRTDRTLTFYTKYGDMFAYLCIVALTVLLFNINLWR